MNTWEFVAFIVLLVLGVSLLFYLFWWASRELKKKVGGRRQEVSYVLARSANSFKFAGFLLALAAIILVQFRKDLFSELVFFVPAVLLYFFFIFACASYILQQDEQHKNLSDWGKFGAKATRIATASAMICFAVLLAAYLIIRLL